MQGLKSRLPICPPPSLTLYIVVGRPLPVLVGKLVAAHSAPERAEPAEAAHAAAKPRPRGRLAARTLRPGELPVEQVAEDEGEGRIAGRGVRRGGRPARPIGVGFSITFLLAKFDYRNGVQDDAREMMRNEAEQSQTKNSAAALLASLHFLNATSVPCQAYFTM